MADDYQNWEPLKEIASMLDGVSLSQLSEWERRRDKNGFPEPKQKLGRFKFFDPEEVKRWVYLWRKVSSRYEGQGERLNAERTEG